MLKGIILVCTIFLALLAFVDDIDGRTRFGWIKKLSFKIKTVIFLGVVLFFANEQKDFNALAEKVHADSAIHTRELIQHRADLAAIDSLNKMSSAYIVGQTNIGLKLVGLKLDTSTNKLGVLTKALNDSTFYSGKSFAPQIGYSAFEIHIDKAGNYIASIAFKSSNAPAEGVSVTAYVIMESDNNFYAEGTKYLLKNKKFPINEGVTSDIIIHHDVKAPFTAVWWYFDYKYRIKGKDISDSEILRYDIASKEADILSGLKDDEIKKQFYRFFKLSFK